MISRLSEAIVLPNRWRVSSSRFPPEELATICLKTSRHHKPNTFGYPLNMLLHRRDHVCQYRRASRSSNCEKIGKASRCKTKIRAWPVLPFLFQFYVANPCYINFFKCASHSIEAGGKYDGINFKFFTINRYAVRSYAIYGLFTYVYQIYIFPVESFIVTRCNTETFTTK